MRHGELLLVLGCEDVLADVLAAGAAVFPRGGADAVHPLRSTCVAPLPSSTSRSISPSRMPPACLRPAVGWLVSRSVGPPVPRAAFFLREVAEPLVPAWRDEDALLERQSGGAVEHELPSGALGGRARPWSSWTGKPCRRRRLLLLQPSP